MEAQGEPVTGEIYEAAGEVGKPSEPKAHDDLTTGEVYRPGKVAGRTSLDVHGGQTRELPDRAFNLDLGNPLFLERILLRPSAGEVYGAAAKVVKQLGLRAHNGHAIGAAYGRAKAVSRMPPGPHGEPTTEVVDCALDFEPGIFLLLEGISASAADVARRPRFEAHDGPTTGELYRLAEVAGRTTLDAYGEPTTELEDRALVLKPGIPRLEERPLVLRADPSLAKEEMPLFLPAVGNAIRLFKVGMLPLVISRGTIQGCSCGVTLVESGSGTIYFPEGGILFLAVS